MSFVLFGLLLFSALFLLILLFNLTLDIHGEGVENVDAFFHEMLLMLMTVLCRQRQSGTTSEAARRIWNRTQHQLTTHPLELIHVVDHRPPFHIAFFTLPGKCNTKCYVPGAWQHRIIVLLS